MVIFSISQPPTEMLWHPNKYINRWHAMYKVFSYERAQAQGHIWVVLM